jgi:predicted nuclease of predicted toxin-antitoxin system
MLWQTMYPRHADACRISAWLYEFRNDNPGNSQIVAGIGRRRHLPGTCICFVGNGREGIASFGLGGKVNFLLNMNVNRDMTAQLEKRGHVCRHVGDIGMNRATDTEIVLEAKRTGEVILTHDLDYGHLLAFSGEKAPSVVILRLRDLRTDEVVSRLETVWKEVEAALMDGAIISLSDKSLRIRRLPIEAE